MMLSELYGRIGQVLREHGDAPIADLRTPMFEPHMLQDFYVHKHVDVVFCTTQIPIGNGKEAIKSYNLNIEQSV